MQPSDGGNVDVLVIGGLVAAGIVYAIAMIVMGKFFRIWLRALLSGTPVGLPSLVGMSLRKVNPALMVDSHIMLTKAGITIVGLADLETHYLSGGNVMAVAQALIAASMANVELTFKEAAALDLAGGDPLKLVQEVIRAEAQGRNLSLEEARKLALQDMPRWQEPNSSN